MPVGDIYELVIHYDQYSQHLMNVFHYKQLIADPPTQNPADLLLDGIVVAGGLKDTIRNCIASDCTIVKVTAQGIYPSRYRYITRAVGQAGAWGSAASTANVAASIEKFTHKAGRSQVGRVQIPISPLPDASVAGQLTAEMLEALQNVADVIPFVTHAGEGVGAQFSPVLFHRQNPDTPNIPPSWDDIAGAIVQRTTRVMSRRTVGRGI